MSAVTAPVICGWSCRLLGKGRVQFLGPSGRIAAKVTRGVLVPEFEAGLKALEFPQQRLRVRRFWNVDWDMAKYRAYWSVPGQVRLTLQFDEKPPDELRFALEDVLVKHRDAVGERREEIREARRAAAARTNEIRVTLLQEGESPEDRLARLKRIRNERRIAFLESRRKKGNRHG